MRRIRGAYGSGTTITIGKVVGERTERSEGHERTTKETP
jgi:hypothetical protein